MQRKKSENSKKRRKMTDDQSQDIFSWQSDDWFYNLTEYIPGVSIQGYTSDGTVIFWNKASEEIYGYLRQEAIGKNLADLIIPDDIRPLFEDALEMSKTVTTSGELMPAGELLLLRKDGSMVPVYSIHTIVCHPEKESVLFCIDVDLSEQKQIESQLKQMAQILEDKNNHLESIIQIATHDLQTPIVNAVGFAGELGKSLDRLRLCLEEVDMPEEKRAEIQACLDDEIPESLSFVKQGIKKMKSLLAALLRLAHLGVSPTHFEELDMNELVDEIGRDLSFQIKTTCADIEIQDLPDCRGDRFQMNCVFSNLFGNALKYLDPARKGHISISGKEEDGRVVYCVSDNGIGIEADNIKNIFKVFYRVNGNDQDGQGLGLAVAERILDRHNGEITVESEIGKGSRFFVIVPTNP